MLTLRCPKPFIVEVAFNTSFIFVLSKFVLLDQQLRVFMKQKHGVFSACALFYNNKFVYCRLLVTCIVPFTC